MAISQRTTPNAKMSAFSLQRFPMSSSGAACNHRSPQAAAAWCDRQAHIQLQQAGVNEAAKPSRSCSRLVLGMSKVQGTSTACKGEECQA